MAIAELVLQETGRGDTPQYNFTITNVATGLAIDLTGATIAFMAKERISDTDANAKIDRDCTITDATNGKCFIKLTEAETGFTGNSNKVYEAELESRKGGDVLTYAQGRLKIKPDVKQDA